MRLIPKSLFGRLILILLSGLILAQGLSTLLLLRDRGAVLEHRLGQQLIQRIGSIVSLVENLPSAQQQLAINSLNTPQFRVSLSPVPNNPGTRSRPADRLSSMLRQQLPDETPIMVTVSTIGDEWIQPDHRWQQMPHMPSANRPWRKPPLRQMNFLVSVALSDGRWLNIQRDLPDELHTWPIRLLGYIAILLISVILLSLIAVRLATRPLKILAHAAENLGRDLSRPPLDLSGPTEVKKASEAFNTMQLRLRRYIEDRSQVLAAISHDLKTPITRLRLRTEMLEDPLARDKFSHDLDQMEQMVLATLDYLRGTEGKEKPLPVDIMALLASIQDDISELGWSMNLTGASPIICTVRPLALKRCLGNLIENAIRYGKQADVRVEMADRQLTVIIADRGETLPETDLEPLFDPFYRREASRSKETGGTGLGLGIARNIARSHGGDVVLRKLEPQGIEAVVTLPC